MGASNGNTGSETLIARIQGALQGRRRRLERSLQGAPWSVALGGLLCFALLGLFSCVGPQSAQTHEPPLERGIDGAPWIRVLIVEDAPSATLAIDGLATVHTVHPETGEPTLHAPVATLDALDTTELRADGKAVIIEGRARYSGAVALRPQKPEALTVNGVRFRGELVIRPEDGRLRIINSLPLEDYLCGVLGKEMPLSFPDAALDAQAVAARSYALWHLSRRKSRDHDVKNDTRSQVYGGLSAEHPKARAVIERTRGRIARYQGKPFQCYFHSTCGGRTVPAHWVFGGKPQAPLSGADCGRCVSSKYYRWQKELPRAEAIAALRRNGFSLSDPIESIEALSWERGRYQRLIRIRHGGGLLEVPSMRARTAFKLRSIAFDMTVERERILFDGEGWGHGVGLCQVGAKGFAQEGLSGDLIIEHYYPGATVEKVY